MSWERILNILGNSAYFFLIITIIIWTICTFLGIIGWILFKSYWIFFKKSTFNREMLSNNGIDLNFWDNFLRLRFTMINFLTRNWCINSNWIIATFSFTLSSTLVIFGAISIEGALIGFLICLFPDFFHIMYKICEIKVLGMIQENSYFFHLFHDFNKLKLDDQLIMCNEQIDNVDFDELANLITLNLINQKDVPNLLTKKLIKCKQRITKFRNLSGKITLKQLRNLKVDLMTNYFIVIIEMCRLQKNEALPFATNGNDTYTWTQLTSKINRCFFTNV